MVEPNVRGRWVAILTGAISILIGVLYLGLITVLDARGPLLPPLPRPWAWWQLRILPPLQRLHHPLISRFQKALQGSLPPVEVVLAAHHLLQTAVSPVLVLLEIGQHALAGDTGQPGGTHPLDHLAEGQRRQVQRQR